MPDPHGFGWPNECLFLQRKFLNRALCRGGPSPSGFLVHHFPRWRRCRSRRSEPNVAACRRAARCRQFASRARSAAGLDTSARATASHFHAGHSVKERPTSNHGSCALNCGRSHQGEFCWGSVMPRTGADSAPIVRSDKYRAGGLPTALRNMVTNPLAFSYPNSKATVCTLSPLVKR